MAGDARGPTLVTLELDDMGCGVHTKEPEPGT